MKKAVLWLTVAVLSFGISGCDSAIPIPGLGIGKEAEEETTKGDNRGRNNRGRNNRGRNGSRSSS